MPVSRSNPRIKYIRRLARRRFREQEEKFLVEGARFLEEAVRENWPLELAVYTPEWAETPRGDALMETLREKGVPFLAVDRELLSELAETENPQGVLAVAEMRRRPEAAPWHSPDCQNGLLVLVDGIRDPGNLGTIIRCADACAAAGVLMTPGTVDPFNPKTLRATMGAVFRVPLIPLEEPSSAVANLHAAGWRLVAGDPGAEKYIHDFNLSGPVVLAVGGEAAGFSGALGGGLADFVRIPMPGRAESLNAGVAACIMLYEVVRQRMARN